MTRREHRRAGRLRPWAVWLAAWWVPLAGVLVFGVTVAVSLRPQPPSISPERYAGIVAKVLPKDGYTLPVSWGDLGPQLVTHGVIVPDKLTALLGKDGAPVPADLRRLEAPSDAPIRITRENEWFLVTVFWGLGLANRSPLLDGLSAARGQQTMQLASTGGWTLGARPAAELYNRFDIVPLTPPQQALVSELATSIHRPCCGNATALADCNHGMALLGLIEVMAAQGVPREEILRAALTVNAFWFPREYTKIAVLFHLRGVEWDAVDPREVLGPRFSSLSGWEEHVDRELRKYSRLLPPGAEGARCVLT